MKKDNLSTLIQSLSKAEKRYFKLYAGRSSKTKVANHLLLFDSLNKESNAIFDYKAFQRTYKIKNVSALKDYLMEAILDAISEYKSKSDGKIALLEELQYMC